MRVQDLLGHKPPTVITVDPGADLATAVRLMMEHSIGGLPVGAPMGRAVGFVAERDIVAAVHQNREEVRRLRVEQVMRPVPSCSPDDSLADVMGRMTRQRTRHLVVQEGGRTVGVISVGDLVKHRLEQLETEAGVLRDYVAAQRASR